VSKSYVCSSVDCGVLSLSIAGIVGNGDILSRVSFRPPVSVMCQPKRKRAAGTLLPDTTTHLCLGLGTRFADEACVRLQLHEEPF
jgi:hypothetical protein